MAISRSIKHRVFLRSQDNDLSYLPEVTECEHLRIDHLRSQGLTFNNCPIKTLEEVLSFLASTSPKTWKTLEPKSTPPKGRLEPPMLMTHPRLVCSCCWASTCSQSLKAHSFLSSRRWPHQCAKFRRLPCSTVESLVCFVLSHSIIALDNCIQGSNHPILTNCQWRFMNPLSPHTSYQSVIHQTVGVDWDFLQKSEVVW